MYLYEELPTRFAVKVTTVRSKVELLQHYYTENEMIQFSAHETSIYRSFINILKRKTYCSIKGTEDKKKEKKNRQLDILAKTKSDVTFGDILATNLSSGKITC
mgnify:CR=1 FL=1